MTRSHTYTKTYTEVWVVLCHVKQDDQIEVHVVGVAVSKQGMYDIMNDDAIRRVGETISLVEDIEVAGVVRRVSTVVGRCRYTGELRRVNN